MHDASIGFIVHRFTLCALISSPIKFVCVERMTCKISSVHDFEFRIAAATAAALRFPLDWAAWTCTHMRRSGRALHTRWFIMFYTHLPQVRRRTISQFMHTLSDAVKSSNVCYRATCRHSLSLHSLDSSSSLPPPSPPPLVKHFHLHKMREWCRHTEHICVGAL